jgi:enamine deaminase RidA (YjgF/YER057c/UK114 family)
MGAEARLSELGLELPSSPPPVASYVPIVISGDLAFVAGQLPIEEGVLLWSGKLGADLDVADGAAATRRCGLQALAVLRDALGTLDRIRRIVKLTVYVASAPGFVQHPKVADGVSDLMAEVFGDDGRHARVSIGVIELPLGAPVEVDVVAEISA